MLEFIERNWALISIALTVGLLGLVPYVILRKYVKIALNIVKHTVPPMLMGPKDFRRIEGEVIEFSAFDGLPLRGMFLYGNPERRPRGTIIFAHEFMSDMYSSARYCQGMLEAGFDVFSFDFRCHGGSTKEEGYEAMQWCTDRELNDILGAIAYVEDWLEQLGRPPDIGLFGISRGGSACLLAARHNPVVSAIVVDGVFSSDRLVEYFMRRWASIFAKVRFVYENHPPTFWRFLRWMLFCECKRKFGIRLPSAMKAVQRMDATPILYIHGAKDSYIPVDQSRVLYAATKDPRFMWIVPGAKHNQSAIVAPGEYARRTTSFFDQFLAPQEIASAASAADPDTAEVGAEPSAAEIPTHATARTQARLKG